MSNFPMKTTSVVPKSRHADLKDELLPFNDPDGFLYHYKILNVMDREGFDVRKIEKLWVHHIWWVHAARGTAVLPDNLRRARHPLVRLFQANNISVQRDSLEVVHDRQKLVIGFTWEEGVAGILVKRTPHCATFRIEYEPGPDNDFEKQEEMLNL